MNTLLQNTIFHIHCVHANIKFVNIFHILFIICYNSYLPIRFLYRFMFVLNYCQLDLDCYTIVDKKFELMLTRRAKAYSSSCSQTLSLSPAISSQFIL